MRRELSVFCGRKESDMTSCFSFMTIASQPIRLGQPFSVLPCSERCNLPDLLVT